jgi:hypothetical protein
MLIRKGALGALAVLMLAAPALAQETAPADPAEAAPASASDAPPAGCAAPPRKGPGLGALLAAANQAGAGDLLSGRSGQLFGSGKRGSIAGAVLGTALSNADPQATGGEYGGGPMPSAAYGNRKAQIAAAATGAVINLARSRAAASAAAPCAGN